MMPGSHPHHAAAATATGGSADPLSFKAALLRLLAAHQPLDPAEHAHWQQTLEFVSRTVHPAGRSAPEGHVTASAWILSPQRDAALLTHHKKLGRWLQLGGHVEADASIELAALREASEESGLQGLTLLDAALFDVDVHRIPARKDEAEHLHFDCRFLLQAPSLDFVVSEESSALAWLPLHRIDASNADAAMLRMVQKTASWLAMHTAGHSGSQANESTGN